MPAIHTFFQECGHTSPTFYHRYSSLGAFNNISSRCFYQLPDQPPATTDVAVYGDYIEFYNNVHMTSFFCSNISPNSTTYNIYLDSGRFNNPPNPNVPILIGTVDLFPNGSWVINLTDQNQIIPHVPGYQYVIVFPSSSFISDPPFRLQS